MTWQEVVSTANTLSKQFRSSGSVAWFRGQCCEDWQLKSSGHRHVERLTSLLKENPPTHELVMLLRQILKRLYRRFKADAWPLLDQRERSDWAILFTMQHYGIPTRLLDWSESFMCAAYFAQRGRKRGQAAAIWVLDPQALNAASLSKDGILALDDSVDPLAVVDTRDWHPKWIPSKPIIPTVAAAPIYTNRRMVAQRSVFTLSGDSFAPIDQEFPQLTKTGKIVKLVLSPESYDAVDEYLQSAGVTAFNYYPDLQGLAMKHAEEVEQTVEDAKQFYPDQLK